MATTEVLNYTRELSYPTAFSSSQLLPLLLLSLTSQRHTPRTKTIFRDEYDYIIVGAGSAGSVVARRLSELSCVTVLLLEAGSSAPIMTEVPAIATDLIGSDIDWKFQTTPQKHTAAAHINRQLPWPSGKALGGSSVLNAMLYVRGNRRNYDEWAQQGAKGWSYAEVLPYFKKLEEYTDPIFLQNGFHNISGPVTVSKPAYDPVQKLAAINAALSLGYSIVDSNGPFQSGFYDLDVNTRRGQRCSTAKAYLVPSDDRKNLDILSSAMVTRIIIEDKIAVGVEFDFNGSRNSVRARKEVILSAGAFNTPQSLMLSGIGPMSELSRHDIPVIADLPVGLNFQDHQIIHLPFEISESIKSLEDKIKEAPNILNYINNRKGPLTSPKGMFLVAFLGKNSSDVALDTPHFAMYFFESFTEKLLRNIGVKQNVLQQYFDPYKNKRSIVCASQILQTKSIGTVTLQSKDPYAPVVIDPNYFADYRDIDDAVQGLKFCNKFMSNPAMQSIGVRPFTTVMPGCEPYVRDEDLYLRCIVRSLVTVGNHQCGTTKMGDPDDPTTVVDPQLRVKSIKNLRVVDASIMPTIPWGNTNIPTIMLAEKASDIIRSNIKC